MKSSSDAAFIQDYEDLIHKVSNDLDSIISEIETLTINNVTERPPQDIIFDAIPLLRKLKHAKQETKSSLNHIHTLKKTKS